MSMVTHPLLYIVWFFLPAITANMVPVVAAKLNLLSALNKPLDGGFVWRGKRLFGDHKTVRGVVAGVIMGAITAAIQYACIVSFPLLSELFFSLPSLLFSIAVGGLIGFGALAGDAIKSFMKRRWSLSPGERWIPYDQIDFVLGAYVVTYWLHAISISDLFIACVIIGIGSYTVSFIAFVFNLKKEI